MGRDQSCPYNFFHIFYLEASIMTEDTQQTFSLSFLHDLAQDKQHPLSANEQAILDAAAQSFGGPIRSAFVWAVKLDGWARASLGPGCWKASCRLSSTLARLACRSQLLSIRRYALFS